MAIGTENWFNNPIIRKIINYKPANSRRHGFTDAYILQHLHVLALGEEKGKVMLGIVPADINHIDRIAEYLHYRLPEVRRAIEIGIEKGLIRVIDREIWMVSIYCFIGSPAGRKLAKQNFSKLLNERSVNPGYQNGPSESREAARGADLNGTGCYGTGCYEMKWNETGRNVMGAEVKDLRSEEQKRFFNSILYEKDPPLENETDREDGEMIET